MELTIEPATPRRWDDVAAVFGTRGEPSRCWCVYLRRGAVSYAVSARDANRATLRDAVSSGTPAGFLAYSGDQPVGFVSAGPRSQFAARLERSPVLAAVPYDGPGGVWSVLCFVVPRPFRGQGVTNALLDGAVAHARAAGAGAVAGVPRDDLEGRRWPAPMAYPGMASMFVRAGFTEVSRRRDRPVYRLVL